MTFDADALPPLRETIRRHGLSADSGLGQHYLMDMNLNRRIVRAAGDLAGQHVLEVGAGPGGLTRALLESPAAAVWAIERDTRCLAALGELATAAGDRLVVRGVDALAFDAAGAMPSPRQVVANLPYNIATPLLVGWLKQAGIFASFTITLQREVADRLVAAPGTKAYSRLSVLAQWLACPRTVLTLPPQAFTPPPKVDSAVVYLAPRAPAPDDPPVAAVETVAAAAFQQRRKMLRRAMRQLTGAPERLLAAAGIDPQTRADRLDVAGYRALARAWHDARSNRESES